MVRELHIRLRELIQHLVSGLFLALVALLGTPDVGFSQIVGRVPRVLILYPYDERLPLTNLVGEAARTRLLEGTEFKIDLYSEFLDLARFPEKVHVDRMARYLAEKYSSRRPDIVIAMEEAISFIAANREAIAPGATIIFCGTSKAEAAAIDLPDDVIAAYSEFDLPKTLELAPITALGRTSTPTQAIRRSAVPRAQSARAATAFLQ